MYMSQRSFRVASKLKRHILVRSYVQPRFAGRGAKAGSACCAALCFNLHDIDFPSSASRQLCARWRQVRPMDSRYASLDLMEPDVGVTKPLPHDPSINPSKNTTDHLTRHQQSRGWTPISLRPISLILFVVLFIALEAALVSMWKLSTRTQGFSFDNHDDHGWSYRYGPTALFVIIISFWRQVDYSCKILRPWQELQRGNVTAENSLFLDYVSPFVPVAVWKSMARGHRTVAFAGVGFLTLKIIAVVSTGLLLAVPSTFIDTNISMVATTSFNFTSTTTVPNVVLFNTIGIMAYGLSHPEGTSVDAAYQRLIFPQNSTYDKAKFTAVVQALYPLVTCEQRDFTHQVTNITDDNGYVKSILSISDQDPCNFTSNTTLPSPWTTFYPSNVTFLASEFVTCGQTEETWVYLDITAIELSQTFPPNVSYDSNDWYRHSNTQALSSSMHFGKTLSLMCRLDHEIRLAEAQYDLSTTPASIKLKERSSSTDVSSPSLDMEARMTSALSNLDIFPNGNTRWISENSNSLVTLLAESASLQDVFESETLQELAGKAFKELMIQVVAETVLSARNESLSGRVTYQKVRLVMNGVSFGIMSGGLALMIFLSLFFVVKRPRIKLSPDRVDTIKHIAMVLSNSTALHDKFQSVQGRAKTEALGQFQNARYSSSAEHGSLRIEPSIYVEPRATEYDAGLETRSNEVRWWYPASLNRFALGSLLVVPILLILVLEILQRVSDARNGFATLPTNISKIVQNGYISYIPAIVMLLTATLYTSLDFNAAILAPLTSLKRDVCDVDQIQNSVVGQLPPMALLSTIRHRQWGALSASVAALMGSILTIIVSGLYTINSIQPQSSLSLHRSDVFNPVLWNTSFANFQRSTTGGASVVFSVLETTDVRYPGFTYDELAFPSFKLLTNDSSPYPAVSGKVRVKVPALRGNLNCQRFLPSQMNITEASDSGLRSFSVYVNMPVPASCLPGVSKHPSWNATRLGYRFEGGFPTEKAAASPDLFVMDDVQQRYIFVDGLEPETPLGCPSLSWSWAAHDYKINKTSYHTMYCNQEIQQVQATLSLNLPNMTISTSDPPIVDESSAKLVTSEPNGGETAFNWYFDMAVTGFSLKQQSTIFSAPIFEAVFYGRKPIDLRTMLDDEDKVANGIQAIYRRFMAQVINRNMRTSFTDGDIGQYGQDQPRVIVQGNFTPDEGQRRIVQQMAPKLVLQCMLGTMFLLGLVSISTGGYRRLVPWNPCSIAGKAILVAGSKMCTMKAGLQAEHSTELQPWPLQPKHSSGKQRDAKVAMQFTTQAHSDVESINYDTAPLIVMQNNSKATLDSHNNGGNVNYNYHTDDDHMNETAAPEIITEDAVTDSSPMLPSGYPIRPSKWSKFGFTGRTDRQNARQQAEWRELAKGDMSTARFRLGWWSKDGYFVGPDDRYIDRMRADTAPNMNEDDRTEWRYGIDFL